MSLVLIGDCERPAFLYPFDSEVTVIGAALSGLEWAETLGSRLTEAHFSEPPLGRVWSAIQSIVVAGTKQPDAVLVANQLRDDVGFQDLGALSFLMDAVDKTPSWTAAAHADIVIDRAWRRKLLEITSDARSRVMSAGDQSAFDHLTELERQLAAAIQDAAPSDTYVTDATTAAFGTVERLEHEAETGKVRGLLTGLRCFDLRTRGLQPGWLIVLAGRPSMGKTALARSTAMAAASRNPKHLIIYFTVEMDRDELSERTLSELSFIRTREPIAFKDMVGSKLNFEERSALRRMAALAPDNLIIDDNPVLSLNYIRRRLYALRAKAPLGAVFIDYLQIMKRPPSNGRNDAAVIQEMTTSLKNLARELGVCIVLLSQVNRGVEGRDDKRPQLADLRESGAIEQDANAVLFCYREFYYLERSEPKPSASSDARTKWETDCENSRRRLDVVAAKVRGGPVGSDQQVYFAEYDHIEDQRSA